MTLSTGELAGRVDVNIETVRYYERRGLMPEPPRSGAGYRQYTRQHLRRLHFIRRAQALGFTLDEIETLLSLRAEPNAPNAEVKRQAKEKLDETRRRIRDLENIRDTLEELYAACDGEGTTSDCPILEAIELPGEGALGESDGAFP